MNFAFTGSIDKLQSHLDPVGIRLVEDEPAPRTSVLLSVERTRVCRIRDLLHTDNNLHDRGVCQSKGGMPIRANRIV